MSTVTNLLLPYIGKNSTVTRGSIMYLPDTLGSMVSATPSDLKVEEEWKGQKRRTIINYAKDIGVARWKLPRFP